uniref:G_PROTEIN_RECEP_F1_2 domain-containing protein n=1 Tax=Bursaphelenchus xylophilus TaxID=6326 RepID=A0A1I7RWQ3_BURXY
MMFPNVLASTELNSAEGGMSHMFQTIRLRALFGVENPNVKMSWQDTAANIFPYYEYSVGITSYILNILVIYLARTQMHKRTAEYKIIIYLNCGVDLIFITVSMVTRSVCDVQDGIFFILSTGPLGEIPQPYAAMISVVWSGAFMLTVVTVPIQFLYRYSQLCLKNQITTRQYVLIYGGFISALVVHLVVGFHIYVTDPTALKEYEHLLRRNPMFREHVPVFTAAITISLVTQLHMLNTMLIVCVAYSVAVYCAVKTLKRLNESQDSFSKATRAAQRQFTIIMFVQAINPLVMLNIPICLAYSLTLLNVTLALCRNSQDIERHIAAESQQKVVGGANDTCEKPLNARRRPTTLC